ncbi:MAG: hypothetical protein RIC55_07265 [Pirellulaceae bacterium]
MAARIALTTLVLLSCGAARADDARMLLYLSDAGPLVIQLRVTIDGESHQAAWSKFVQKLFADLDRNDDGALMGAEIDAVPTRQQLLQTGLPIVGGRAEVARAADSAPRDGRVTPDEFADYLQRTVGDSLSVTIAGRNQSARGGFAANPAPSGDSALMEQLDVDEDGKLSAEEFVLSSDMLKFDLDDDGVISRGELQPLQSPYYRLARRSGGAPNVAGPFLDLGGDSSPTWLVRRIIEQYDGGEKDGQLSREELKSGGDRFATLDLDGNGQLDFDELRRLFRGDSPHILVVVRLGKKRQEQRTVEVTVAPAAKDLVDGVREGGQADAVLALDKQQLEFSTSSGASTSVVASIFEQQFGALDRDNNGYLDKAEVENNRTLRDAFQLIDADGDEKVFEKEFVAYFERLAEAARARTLLTISDQGNRLFDILDANRDGRLSPREVAAGRDKIGAWDEDDDQLVAADEIPQTWRLEVARGAPRFGVVNVATMQQTAARTRTVGGPPWFSRMDRNEDGEVTRREFLGELAEFDRLDADDNGAVDAQEALAAN